MSNQYESSKNKMQMGIQTKMTKILERLWFENNLEKHYMGQRVYIARISPDWKECRLAMSPNNLIKIGHWLKEEEITMIKSIWQEDSSIMQFLPPIKNNTKEAISNAQKDEFNDLISKIIEESCIKTKIEFDKMFKEHVEFIQYQYKADEESIVKIVLNMTEKYGYMLNELKQQTKWLEAQSTSESATIKERVHIKSNGTVKTRNTETEATGSITEPARVEMLPESNNAVAGRSIKKGAKGVKGSGVKTCFSCGQNGHMSNDCPNPDRIHCYRCNNLGNHIAKDCTKKSNFIEDLNNDPVTKRIRLSFSSQGRARNIKTREKEKKTITRFKISKQSIGNSKSYFLYSRNRKPLRSDLLKPVSSNGHRVNLKNLLCSENLYKNILSLRRFVEKGFEIYLDDQEINIVDPTTREKITSGVYKLKSWAIPLKANFNNNETKNENRHGLISKMKVKDDNNTHKENWNC